MIIPVADNPFLLDPFKYLQVDAMRYDPEGTWKIYNYITDALGSYYQASAINKQKKRALGPKPKQSADYEAMMAETDDLDAKIQALEKKKDSLERLFDIKKSQAYASRGQM